MALTSPADLYVTFHEDGINRLIAYLAKYRPRYFNYGSKYFHDSPWRCPIPVEEEQITEENPITIPGTKSLLNVHYCIQFRNVLVDLHPKTIELLDPLILEKEQFALLSTVFIKMAFPQVPPEYELRDSATILYDSEKCNPLTLNLAIVGSIHKKGISRNSYFYFVAERIRSAEILPSALECIIEQTAIVVLNHGLLKRIKFELENISLKFLEVEFNTEKTPNPSITDNAFHTWLDVREP